jgi:tetratricopeptide (TPR) repeat protein
MLAEAFRLVGQSYNEIKLFDQSIENYKQAYEILLPLKNENCLYRSLFDIGRNLILANKYSEAIEIFFEIFNKTTTDNERAFITQHISICYLNLNNYDQAKNYAYKSLDYASISNEEFLFIEGNILLGKIYFQLKDFQRAEEYIIYAQNLKDQLGDLNQMKYLDELIFDIKNHKEKIFQEKISPLVQFEEDYLNKINEQWISSIMQKDETKEINTIENQFDKTKSYNWRILTPYHRLFDMCLERKKKTRRNMDNVKQPIATSSLSLPLISTTNNISDYP